MKKYNIVTIFMMIVVAGLAFCFFYNKNGGGAQAEESHFFVPVETVEEKIPEKELFTEPVYLKTSEQAIKQYFYAMSATKGYTSKTVGTMTARKFGINIRENINVYKQVNQLTDETLTSMYIYKTESFGLSRGIEVYNKGDNVLYRRGGNSDMYYEQLKERIDSTQPSETSLSNYLDELYVLPKSILMPISNADIKRDGEMNYISCYSPLLGAYSKVRFNIDAQCENFKNTIDFILTLSNAKHHNISFQFRSAKGEFLIGEKGQVLSQKITLGMKFDLSPIGIPIVVDGDFSMTESFSNWNKAISIDKTELYPQ